MRDHNKYTEFIEKLKRAADGEVIKIPPDYMDDIAGIQLDVNLDTVEDHPAPGPIRQGISRDHYSAKKRG